MKKPLRLGLAVGTLILLLAIVSACLPTTTPPPSGGTGGFDWQIIIFLVVIFAIFYLLMIRPQRKRQKQQQTLLQELRKGDKVITAGGIYGEIDSVADDSVVIRVESGALLRVARGGVIAKRPE